MSKHKGGEGEVAEAIFNLAAVMIFILIFLILSSKELFQSTSVDVDIPKANVIEADLEQSIAISITKEGKYYVGNDEVPLEKIHEIVLQKQKEYHEKNPDLEFGDQLVVIRADKSINWQMVLDAIDQAKKGKSRRITLAVIKKQG